MGKIKILKVNDDKEIKKNYNNIKSVKKEDFDIFLDDFLEISDKEKKIMKSIEYNNLKNVKINKKYGNIGHVSKFYNEKVNIMILWNYNLLLVWNEKYGIHLYDLDEINYIKVEDKKIYSRD